MAGTLFRSMFTNTLSVYTNTTKLRSLHTATVTYAARKGTREKARAKKVKVEVTKVGFIPHNQRGRDKGATKTNVSKHVDDTFKPMSKDNVYPLKYYRWVVYTAEDAVRAHQQTHHPTMYNVPDAYVFAQIEFNMAAAKKNRFMDSFTRLSLLPHLFPREEERSIMAFCKGSELIKEAMDAGASIAGGSDLIKKIQDGTIKLGDYDYVLAHPNVLTDLVPIRGLMKRRFPNVRAGTLDPNLKELVRKFSGGVQFRVLKDEHQENYGFVQVPVGRLNMDPKEVAENLEALLKDVQSARPKRDGLFITRCVLVSPPSPEKLKIDPFVYVDKTLAKEVQEDSDDEGEPVAQAATA